MHQSKLESFVEANANIAIGFFLSLALWHFMIVPLWHLPVNMGDNLAITGCFTVLSVARSYFMRRFFNAGLHRAVQKLFRRRHAAD